MRIVFHPVGVIRPNSLVEQNAAPFLPELVKQCKRRVRHIVERDPQTFSARLHCKGIFMECVVRLAISVKPTTFNGRKEYGTNIFGTKPTHHENKVLAVRSPRKCMTLLIRLVLIMSELNDNVVAFFCVTGKVLEHARIQCQATAQPIDGTIIQSPIPF